MHDDLARMVRSARACGVRRGKTSRRERRGWSERPGGMIRSVVRHEANRDPERTSLFCAGAQGTSSVFEGEASNPYSLLVRTGKEIAVFVTRKSGTEVLILHRSAVQGGYW